MLRELLDKALEEPITRDETLSLFREVTSAEDFLQLAGVASRVRDEEVGAMVKFEGFVAPLAPCTTNPPCAFCSRAAGKNIFDNPLSIEEVVAGAKLMQGIGLKGIEIGGGTVWSGFGEKTIAAVKAINEATSLEIRINFGPALNPDDLAELKKLGVKEICSNLESINPDVFKKIKPGDNLEARRQLAKDIDRAGLGLSSVMMVGIGSSYEDIVEHIFWLKELKNLTRFSITGLNPISGTPLENEPMANPFEVAKVGAVARLVLRNADICFGGMMNDPKLLPLEVMAGGNRVTHLAAMMRRPNGRHGKEYPGTVVEKHGELELVNLLPLTTRIVKEMGMETDVA